MIKNELEWNNFLEQLSYDVDKEFQNKSVTIGLLEDIRIYVNQALNLYFSKYPTPEPLVSAIYADDASKIQIMFHKQAKMYFDLGSCCHCGS